MCADVCRALQDGNTPLLTAAKRASSDNEFLIEAGIEGQKQLEVMRLLLTNGADIEAKDNVRGGLA